MVAQIVKPLIMVAALATTAVASAATLTLTITGVQKVEGALMIAIFDSQDAFDEGGESFRSIRQEVTDETVTVTVEDVPAGQYAIKMYHDANGNGELDMNMMGMPSESYGFSRNKGRFGPPPFNKAVIDVTDEGPNETTIKLR